MKSCFFSCLRVEPALRETAESVPHENQTLSSLIETAVRETIPRRRLQQAFMAWGLRVRENPAQNCNSTWTPGTSRY
jgi:hypothetical protein